MRNRSVENVNERNPFHRSVEWFFDPFLPDRFRQRAQEPDGKQDADPAEGGRYGRIGDKLKSQLEQGLAHEAFRTEPRPEQLPDPGHNADGDHDREQGKQTGEERGGLIPRRTAF